MNWIVAMMMMGDPGWGIVRTQAGTVYVTDVIRNVVWRVDASGKVGAALRERHAHGLMLDTEGKLVGDQTDYDPGTQKFSRWAWKLEEEKLVRLAGVPKELEKPKGLPASLARIAGWEVSGFIEDGEAWWLLEHIPMKEFEGIHTRKAPYLQVRRVEKKTGIGRVLLQVAQGAP
ncbi:MAG: hypothetical protein FJW36_20315 [Acidobacteria bacterium]|nr:hypothetical protein [Acidobacteriota bacterium]